MIELSFPTIKLKNYIKRINLRVKDHENPNLIVYGVSNTEGICITGKEVSENLNNYIAVDEDDYVYNPYRINIGSIGLVPKGVKGIVSPAYVVFKSKGQINNKLLLQYLKSSLGMNLIRWYGNKGGVRDALRYSDLEKIDFPDITKINQDKIINRLSELEIIISKLNKELEHYKISSLRQSILQEAVQGKLTADWRKENPDVEPASELLKRIKAEKEKLIKEGKIKKQKPLTPITQDKIPFELPKGWIWVNIGELYQTIGTKNNQILSKQYLEEGKYPVVDQGKSLIVGYCNDESKILKIQYPVIVFGDHTKNIKYVNYDFIIGADGTKILKPYSLINSKYFYYTLSSYKLEDRGYARHYKILKQQLFPLAPYFEQRQIVKKVDKLMQLCDDLENNLKQAKKYSEQLMEAVLREAFEE